MNLYSSAHGTGSTKKLPGQRDVRDERVLIRARLGRARVGGRRTPNRRRYGENDSNEHRANNRDGAGLAAEVPRRLPYRFLKSESDCPKPLLSRRHYFQRRTSHGFPRLGWFRQMARHGGRWREMPTTRSAPPIGAPGRSQSFGGRAEDQAQNVARHGARGWRPVRRRRWRPSSSGIQRAAMRRTSSSEVAATRAGIGREGPDAGKAEAWSSARLRRERSCVSSWPRVLTRVSRLCERAELGPRSRPPSRTDRKMSSVNPSALPRSRLREGPHSGRLPARGARREKPAQAP